MALITISLKKTSVAATTNFLAVSVSTFYETEKEDYTNINDVRARIIKAVWKKFEVRFAVLSEAQMDYLEEITTEAAPQFIYNSTTYDILVERVNARNRGGSIILTLTDPE